MMMPVSLFSKQNESNEAHFGRGDFFYIQSIVQQLGGREVLLHKVLQDLDSHVRIIDLGKKRESEDI